MESQQPNAPPPDAEPPPARASRVALILFAVGLTVVAAVLAISATSQWSLTFDEPFHILCGYSYVKTGDFRLLPDHPPLAHYLMSLPLLPLDLKQPFAGEAWDKGDYWILAQQFLSPPNDAQQITLRARLVVVAIWLAGAWLVWAWSRRLFGLTGAAISIALYLFYPDFMTHGSLATTDMPATVAFLAALYALARLVERLTIWRAAVFALTAAALILTKYSGLLLAPTFIIVALIVIFRRRGWPARLRRSEKPLSPAWRTAGVGGVALVTIAVSASAIWAALDFRFRAALDPRSAVSYDHMLLQGDACDPRVGLTDEQRDRLVAQYGRDDLSVLEQYTFDHPLMYAVIPTAARAHLLPEAYLRGLAGTIFRADERSAYLMGKTSLEGWWYYFPLAALLKTPTAVLATMLLAGVALWRRRAATDAAPSSFMRDSLTVILAFEAIYWLASMTAHLNIGHRHLLPVYPPLFVLCGAAADWLRSPRKILRAVPGVCVAAVLATNVLTWPNYLGYFTELIGGSRNGAWYLSDSNIDWGQDLIHLADYLRDRPHDEVKLSYFGTADPAWYGLGDVSVFEFLADMQFVERPAGPRKLAEFTPGIYVFSITTLHGTYLVRRFLHWNDELERDLQQREAALRAALAGEPLPEGVTADTIAAQLNQLYYIKMLSKLRERPPDAVVGSSLYVYNLDADALVALLHN